MTNVMIIHFDADRFDDYLRPRFPEINLQCFPSHEAAQEHFPDVEVFMGIGHFLTRDMVDRMPRLKWMQSLITGVDKYLEVLDGRDDVILTSGRGIHGPQMSESAILHMLALSRQVRRLTKNQELRVWDQFTPRVLDNRVAGIMGLGKIAEHMVHVLKAFGMTVHGISRTKRHVPGIDKVFSWDEMEEAVAELDFLILLLPYEEASANLIDAKVFRAMKPDSFLVNLARGGIVVEDDLIAALNTGEIAGAGLDVFATAPLPQDNPLWGMDNVFITPFVAGRSDQYPERILTVCEPNLRHYLAGETDRLINLIQR